MQIQWIGSARATTGGFLGQVQSGGIECRPAFVRWQGLAPRAVSLCQDALDINLEWWRQEDQRVAGDPFFDQDRQDSVLRNYERAQSACDAALGQSAAAMAEYEGCMISLGLDPTRPSAATGDTVPPPPVTRPPQPRPPPPEACPSGTSRDAAGNCVPITPTPPATARRGTGAGGVALLAALVLGGIYLVTQVA
jgi:hypothetical protein